MPKPVERSCLWKSTGGHLLHVTWIQRSRVGNQLKTSQAAKKYFSVWLRHLRSKGVCNPARASDEAAAVTSGPRARNWTDFRPVRQIFSFIGSQSDGNGSFRIRKFENPPLFIHVHSVRRVAIHRLAAPFRWSTAPNLFFLFLGGGKALRPTSTASEMTEVQWESSIERPQLIWEEGSFCFFAVVCVIERHHVNTTLLLSLTVFGSHRKQFNGSLLFFFVSRKISASFFFFN